MTYKARSKPGKLGNKRGHVTVEIKKETYEVLTKKAIRSKMSIRELVNSVLIRDVENEAFLKRTAPALSLLEMNEDSLLILDTEKNSKRIAEIMIRNKRYLCLLDDSHNCIHIRFMMILPECVRFKDKINSI